VYTTLAKKFIIARRTSKRPMMPNSPKTENGREIAQIIKLCISVPLWYFNVNTGYYPCCDLMKIYFPRSPSFL
jgi:hypothetical protein